MMGVYVGVGVRVPELACIPLTPLSRLGLFYLILCYYYYIHTDVE